MCVAWLCRRSWKRMRGKAVPSIAFEAVRLNAFPCSGSADQGAAGRTDAHSTKPKWMRWRTYKRAEQQFDRYEEALDIGSLAAVMKLLGLK